MLLCLELLPHGPHSTLWRVLCQSLDRILVMYLCSYLSPPSCELLRSQVCTCGYPART